MSNARNYEIRLFDRTLVEFAIRDGAFFPEIELGDWDYEYAHLMPCGLAPTPDGLWSWLERRSIPANRRNADRICRELGFALGDLEALYRASMGLSLNDSYWVVPRGFSGKFADYNLYDNAFSEAIGALAVTGEALANTPHGNTPELTTDGTLRKGWRIIDGIRMLYKGASEGFIPGEPASEYLASLIAKDLHLNAVTYKLDTWQEETCSTCENFASKDASYVPFAIATGITDLAGTLWWCASQGMACFEAFCDMLAFDALVCNTDRHMTNFGVLRDNATGTFIGLAPIFDNGRALFPNVSDDDTAQFQLESQLKGPAFGGHSFEEQLSRFIGERQLALLNKTRERGLVGNTLIPGRRAYALDVFLRARAEALLEISPVERDSLLPMLEIAWQKRRTSDDGAFRLPPGSGFGLPID